MTPETMENLGFTKENTLEAEENVWYSFIIFR